MASPGWLFARFRVRKILEAHDISLGNGCYIIIGEFLVPDVWLLYENNREKLPFLKKSYWKKKTQGGRGSSLPKPFFRVNRTLRTRISALSRLGGNREAKWNQFLYLEIWVYRLSMKCRCPPVGFFAQVGSSPTFECFYDSGSSNDDRIAKNFSSLRFLPMCVRTWSNIRVQKTKLRTMFFN